MSQVMY